MVRSSDGHADGFQGRWGMLTKLGQEPDTEALKSRPRRARVPSNSGSLCSVIGYSSKMDTF